MGDNDKRINRWKMGIVIAIGVIAFVSGCAMFQKEDSGQQISMDQLPAAVKAAAEKEIAGAKIIEVEKELKDGKPIYAVTYDENGKEMEVEYSEDGTLLSKGPE